ncbi:hypothetical protein [Virgibacillus halodenitrificans]|uniref:hypothetical protein n=1 Tax=Virgibacillus halodenitrificans TaxID=1482 RepID=UPI000EF4E003|nr:hypothetical protein [Virgibacillus halodenitrificans]
MEAPVLKVMHINPEQATYSFGTPDNPIKETIVFVEIEYNGVPFELELTKRFEQGKTWEMNNVYWNGDNYAIHQMFSYPDIQFIYQNVMKLIYPKLKQIEEQERLIYSKPLQPVEQNKVEDPLTRRGMELTKKIAVKGGWRLGFDVKKDTGDFVFLLVDFKAPQGTPAMVIGLHEIFLEFDNEDAFVEDAVLSFKTLLNQFNQ